MYRFTRCVACIATVLFITSPSAVSAQRGGRGNDSTGGRGAGLPLTPTTPLKFTTDEGTWLELDLSPDGRTIVFDLLGDIYTIPVAGGNATRITSGQQFDAQPHFSPDGKSIVYVSDRSQSDNLWIMNADGSSPRAITRDNDNTKYQSPTFTPDGKYIVASRGNDLYMYYVNGGTGGIRLTGDSAAGGRGAAPGGGRGGATPNVFLGAAVAKDGRYIYTAMRNSAGGGYNQTSLGWQIGVLDRETGHLFTKTNAVGSGMRPELSPDGKWLAYATRNNAETSLMLRDLETGDERVLLPKIQRDDQESRPNRDLVPTFAFTPDSKAIVIGHHGHFWNASVANGHETMIPFTADIDMMIAGPTKETFTFNDSTLLVRQIRDVAASPDGRKLAFVALDRLYVMDLPGGTPKRITEEQVGEYEPAWSPDGRYLAYVTWNDIDGGTVSRIRSDGSGKPEKLSAKPAYYEKPAYSLDGRRIVVGRGPRNMRKDREELERPPEQAVGVELVWLPSNGGAETLITPTSNFGRPHFVEGDTTHLYFSEGNSLVSMRWDGTDQKTILRQGGATGRGGGGGGGDMLMSPNGDKVLVQVEDQAGPRVLLIDAVPMAPNGATINTANLAQSQVPVRKLTSVGGEFANWAHDGKHIYYALGHSLFTYDLAAAETAVRDSIAQASTRGDSLRGARGAAGAAGAAGATNGESRAAYEAARHDVVINVAKDKPRGVVALRGARILTMKEHEIIAKGDIVVKDNRILAVGPQGSVTIPSGAKIIDVSGKTIIPGYVDVHAHMWPAFGVHRSQPFEYLVNLAYGVTTSRDPQTSTTDVLSYSDQVETGAFIGPRILTTGPGVFQATNIKTLADAREVLKKYSDEFYHTETIKQYMSGDRRVRQLILMAAREEHLMPTLEGGLDFKKNLTEAMDGYSGSEHTLPIAPLYKDVLQLYAHSGTTWTPTLIVQYGGPWAENYWYENSDVVNDPKLNRFTPREVVERKGLRRPGWWAPSQWSFPLFAEQAAKMVAAGGHVGMGSHGQLQGLGAQWEIWNIASGGMPKYDVLRVATIFGAEALGHEKEIGSIEAGKMADLQVLDKNPLDDIKNTNTIRYVMRNGRMYDGSTMAEVWPRQKQIARLWWWTNANSVGGQQEKQF